ncbi:MAG: hypothetical protein R2854_25955 [Caldilineaceae bacterium]
MRFIACPNCCAKFSEYRLLLYGILPIVMMLTRPEGLWPSTAARAVHAEREAGR